MAPKDAPPVRIDRKYLDRIEALVPILTRRHPAIHFTRAAVMRMVLEAGCEAITVMVQDDQ